MPAKRVGGKALTWDHRVSLLVVDCQLEILEFLVISIEMLLTDRGMLVLIGKSKLFLARLASPARRASEIGWLSDSLFVSSLCEKFFIQSIFE